jgi:hypothetical protein
MYFLFLFDPSLGFISLAQAFPVHHHSSLRKREGDENTQRIERQHRLLIPFEEYDQN